MGGVEIRRPSGLAVVHLELESKMGKDYARVGQRTIVDYSSHCKSATMAEASYPVVNYLGNRNGYEACVKIGRGSVQITDF